MPTISTELILKTIVEGTEKAREQIKSLQDKVTGAANALVGFGKTTSLFVTAPILLAGKAMLNAASDAQETQNKFESVFGDLKGEAEQFAAALGAAVNRNTTDIKNGLSAFQSFAVGLGYSKKEALGFSEQLQSLSLDFASFYNLSDEEAMGRFISAMSGSSEVLDQFGVNIKQSALDLELQALGLGKSAATAGELEKAQARLSIITRTLTNNGVVGDAIKTSGSFANQLKGLQANVKTLSETLGNILIPKAQQVVASLRELTAAFTRLPVGTQETILNMMALAAAAGPVSFVLGSILKVVAFLISPLGMMAAVLIALGGAFVYAYKESETFRNVIDTALGGIVSLVEGVTTGIKKAWSIVGPTIISGFTTALTGVGTVLKSLLQEARDWAKIFGPIFNFVFDGIRSVVTTVGTFIVNNWKNIKDILAGIFTVLFEPLKIAFNLIYGSIKGFLQIITGDFKGGFTTWRNMTESVGNSIKNIFTTVWTAVKALFSYSITFVTAIFGGMWDTLRNTVSSLGASVTTAVSRIWDSIKTGFSNLVDQAYNWGANMIGGFIDGIKSAPGKLVDAISGVARTVSDYVGFSSPTNKGPGSNSDTWAPNFINMFANGLSAGASKIAQAISPAAQTIATKLGPKLFDGPKAAVSSYVAHVQQAANSFAFKGNSLFSSIENEMRNFSNRVNSLPKELQDPFDRSVKLFQTFTDSYVSGLRKMETEFDKESVSISDNITKLSKELENLNNSFSIDQSDEKKRLAEQFLGQEKKVNQIKKDIEEKQKEIADNSAAIVRGGLEEQSVDQALALNEKKTQLAAELTQLESTLSLEQNALLRAKEVEKEISSEIKDAKRRDRQSDFTNFIEDWNARKVKAEEEYNQKKLSLETEITDLQKHRDDMLAVYQESQKGIIDTYNTAKDVYLSNLNDQALGTKYYTDLMSSYFDEVSEKIQSIGELPFLDGASALSANSIAGELENLKNKRSTSVLGNQLITGAPLSQTTANPITAPRINGTVTGSSAKPTQNINVNMVIDTLVGQDSYARKLLDGFTKQIKKTLAF